MYGAQRIFGEFEMRKKPEWLIALRTMTHRSYWNKPNIVEFFAFITKAVIIIPGLLFGTQIWWLYIFALVSSVMLIWSSTVKTIPTLIWFNLLWSVLAITAIIKYWV